MALDSSTAYAKYLKSKITSGCSEGCSDCHGGEDCSSQDCSCCPPGLMAYYDENGKHAGCLTPNDYQIMLEEKPCQEGYVKLYKEGATPVFRGCVSGSEFAAIYAIVNPA